MSHSTHYLGCLLPKGKDDGVVVDQRIQVRHNTDALTHKTEELDRFSELPLANYGHNLGVCTKQGVIQSMRKPTYQNLVARPFNKKHIRRKER